MAFGTDAATGQYSRPSGTSFLLPEGHSHAPSGDDFGGKDTNTCPESFSMLNNGMDTTMIGSGSCKRGREGVVFTLYNMKS